MIYKILFTKIPNVPTANLHAQYAKLQVHLIDVIQDELQIITD